MRIEHIGIWVKDLEQAKKFYTDYFELQAGEKYMNPRTEFQSYFLTFKDVHNSARVELMQRPDIIENAGIAAAQFGFAHFAIAVGSKDKVDALTERLRADGYPIIGEPRRTGDGYYESVIADLEGNYIEITV